MTGTETGGFAITECVTDWALQASRGETWGNGRI